MQFGRSPGRESVRPRVNRALPVPRCQIDACLRQITTHALPISTLLSCDLALDLNGAVLPRARLAAPPEQTVDEDRDMLRLRTLTLCAMLAGLASGNALAQSAYGGSNPWEVDKEAVYQSGYTNGYADGTSDGEKTGYSSGYSAGRTAGYTAGEKQGDSDGYWRGRGEGYTTGYQDGKKNGENNGYWSGRTEGYRLGHAAGKKQGDSQGYWRGEGDGYDRGWTQGREFGTTKGYQAGYAEGDTVGHARGYAEGDAVGYDRGYAQGDTAGHTRGYAEGDAAGHTRGYAEGDTAGHTRGYAEGDAAGQITGFTDGVAHCLGDPAQCGITPAIALPAAERGETEPNDHIVAADPLVLDVPFWGQAYGSADTDWFYLETTKANQILTIAFAVPGTTAGGWLINVRDAAGNVYAAIDTATLTTSVDDAGNINYKVTLGLAGTYYIEVKSAVTPVSPNPYTLAAMLQDSPLGSGNFQVGFYDAEVEPNDWPTIAYANPLATGVTMYGLVNLTFDVAVPQGSEYQWAQGEPDWFVYTTTGKEIVTLTFCAKEDCGPGDWFVDVYDAAAAARLAGGESELTVDPILAFNTNSDAATDGEPETIRFGLMAAGTYFMRVNHKRLFTAPCAAYKQDTNNNGIIDSGETSACGCDSGYSCDIQVPNPDYDPITDTFGLCADNTGGGTEAQCTVACRCTAYGGVVEVPEGATTGQYNFTWYGTKLPPFTYGSDAYNDFLTR